jgi:hypothetical protein
MTPAKIFVKKLCKMHDRNLREFSLKISTISCPPPPPEKVDELFLPESCKSLLGKLDALERLVFPDLLLRDTAALRVGAPPGNWGRKLGFKDATTFI